PAEQEAAGKGDKESLSLLYSIRTMHYYVTGKTDSMKIYFDKAIQLAQDLPDKNALFTAKYNYANLYWRNNPQQQVFLFTELLQLSKDPSLNHYPQRLYERTAFTFRNAGPSVNYQLMQLHLLLADYDAAGRY